MGVKFLEKLSGSEGGWVREAPEGAHAPQHLQGGLV